MPVVQNLRKSRGTITRRKQNNNNNNSSSSSSSKWKGKKISNMKRSKFSSWKLKTDEWWKQRDREREGERKSWRNTRKNKWWKLENNQQKEKLSRLCFKALQFAKLLLSLFLFFVVITFIHPCIFFVVVFVVACTSSPAINQQEFGFQSSCFHLIVIGRCNCSFDLIHAGGRDGFISLVLPLRWGGLDQLIHVLRLR